MSGKKRLTPKQVDRLVQLLYLSVEALEHAVQWIDGFAIPAIDPESGGDVEGGNSLSAGLAHQAEESLDFLKTLDR